MKQILIALLLLSAIHTGYGQQSPCEKTMEESLKQMAEILNKPESRNLWNVALNAPIIIIDHVANKMYFTAIENGNVQPMKEEPWDNKVPIANSTFEFNGKRYVTIVHMWLMNSSCEERISLLAHEIFHLHQNSLGIQNFMSTNFYMDETEGRTLLQMEMKALQQALDGDVESLQDALHIRAYRQNLYPNNNEDLFELSEGLAAYMGMKLSMDSILSYAKNRLNYDVNIGYTNTFGFATGTAYAILLDGLYPQWKQDKDLNKGMIFLLKKSNPEYDITVDSSHLNKLFDKFSYDKILCAEKEALKSFGDVVAFEALLKPETSKLSVMNNGIYITYNMNDRVIAFDNAVLLRNITLKGEWGEVKAENIVRLNDWSAFHLLPPKEINGAIIKGDGYEIQLNKGWKVVNADGIYKIEKGE
ncbi:MAG: hypothetical protein LBU91_09375 [Bacteroidales bacterium]|jgi:hypothetical protein|nr:hypothetical protein [Bacteroidales bacterium]